MIIPTDASNGVQAALRDLNDRLAAAERRVQELERPAVTPREAPKELKPNTLDFNDVFRKSGPAHALGYVADPGESAWDERVVSEDGGWKFPLRGIIRPATILGRPTSNTTSGETGAGGTEFNYQGAGEIAQVHGSLAVTGNVGANRAFLNSLRMYGGPMNIDAPLGMQLFNVGFTGGNVGGNANSGAGETDLSFYDFQLLANTLRYCGDFLLIRGTVSAANNTNAKTLKFYIGATSRTIWTSAAAVASHIGHFIMFIMLRSGTTGSITGIYGKDSATDAAETIVLVNAGFNVTWTSENTCKLTAQGGASSDLIMTDYNIILFRGGLGYLLP